VRDDEVYSTVRELSMAAESLADARASCADLRHALSEGDASEVSFITMGPGHYHTIRSLIGYNMADARYHLERAKVMALEEVAS
jgi:hypothetical protein